MDNGVIWSSGFDFLKALQLGGGQLAAVDDCPNATHP